MQHLSEICSNCDEETKCRRRDFSEQAWSALVLWNEIQMTAVDQPICEHCYNELREVLIDRADEIEGVLTEPAVVDRKGKKAMPGQKVRKAS